MSTEKKVIGKITSEDAESEAMRLAHNERVQFHEGMFTTIRYCAGCLLGMVVAGFFYLGVKEAVGKQTSFNAVINALVDIKLGAALGWGSAAAATVAWRRERTLRQRTIKDLAGHSQNLEVLLSPHRSSSGLQLTGQPKKDDDHGA